MSMTYRFRFTLGQSLGFIALAALLMAATIFSSQGNHIYLMLPIAIVSCAGLGVFVYNVRLSRWMWLVIVGYVGPGILGTVEGLVFVNLLPPLSNKAMTTMYMAQQLAMSIFFVIGFAMTFRDIRRRLTIGEIAT